MKGTKFGIIILGIVIILIALIQAGQKTPIDWNKTYNPHDKIPFGTYVIKRELKSIFPKNKSIKNINQSLYRYLNDSISQQPSSKDLFFIGSQFHPGKTAMDALLTFVHKGNNVFLATYRMPNMLEDTLQFETSYFNDYLAGIPFKNDSVFYTLPAYRLNILTPKHPSQIFFNKLNDPLTTILGYLKRDTVSVPNFVSIPFGKGNFYLQLSPEAYSNYYMLDSATYPLAYQSLHHLKGKHILWYDGFFGAKDYQQSKTPLRFILSKPPLRSAWYLLLITLILFLIFKSKREQKAIPILEPEKNLSVSFAQTIGSLYYESGHPDDMIKKKIQYFLYFIKKEFRFENTDIEKQHFREKATLSLKLSRKEIDTFFDKLYFYKNKTNPTTQDLKDLQKLIEDFKHKTNLK